MATPLHRLKRMRDSFEKDKSVLSNDYRYFIMPITPRAPTRQSKAARKSAGQSGQQSRDIFVKKPDKHAFMKHAGTR